MPTLRFVVFLFSNMLLSVYQFMGAESITKDCFHEEQLVLTCYNKTHYLYKNCGGILVLHNVLCRLHMSLIISSLVNVKIIGGVNSSKHLKACHDGFFCENSTGSCVSANISLHLLRSVDYQIVESTPAIESLNCSRNPSTDASAGKMLW